MSLSHKEEQFNQNDIEYKGIFYNDNPTHLFHEGGAHFKYLDLFKQLQELEKKQSRNTTKVLSSRNNIIQEEDQEHLMKESKSKSNNRKLHIQVSSFRPNFTKSIKELSLPKMYINNNNYSNANFNQNQRKVKKILVSKDKTNDSTSLSKDKSKSIVYYNISNAMPNKHLCNSSSLAYIMNIKYPTINNNSNSNVIPIKLKDMKQSSRNYLNSIQKSIALNDYTSNDKERNMNLNMNNTILIRGRNLSKIYKNNYSNNNDNQQQQFYQNSLKLQTNNKNRIIVKFGAGGNSKNKQLNIGLKKSSSSCFFEHKTAYPSHRGIHNTSGPLINAKK